METYEQVHVRTRKIGTDTEVSISLLLLYSVVQYELENNHAQKGMCKVPPNASSVVSLNTKRSSRIYHINKIPSASCGCCIVSSIVISITLILGKTVIRNWTCTTSNIHFWKFQIILRKIEAILREWAQFSVIGTKLTTFETWTVYLCINFP